MPSGGAGGESGGTILGVVGAKWFCGRVAQSRPGAYLPLANHDTAAWCFACTRPWGGKQPRPASCRSPCGSGSPQLLRLNVRAAFARLNREFAPIAAGPADITRRGRITLCQQGCQLAPRQPEGRIGGESGPGQKNRRRRPSGGDAVAQGTPSFWRRSTHRQASRYGTIVLPWFKLYT